MASLARLSRIAVSEVSGFSGSRGRALVEGGVATVADLLFHVPRRYIDRSRVEPIALIPIGEEVTVIARVLSVRLRRPRRSLSIVEAVVTDGTATLKAVWFNQTFRARQLAEGAEVALSGKLERFRAGYQMKSPDVDVLGDTESLITGRVVPVHPTVKGVGTGWIRRGVHNALRRSIPIPDPFPQELLEQRRLAGRQKAFSDIHFPESLADIGPARRRLAFDELFRMEIALAMAKHRQMQQARGVAHQLDGSFVSTFLDGLPYAPTSAQIRVLEEIRTDLSRSHPMHRMLQGEVGSGKTMVAVAALLYGIEGGFQGAIMAPTEVLATQHFLGVSALLEQVGLGAEFEGEGASLGMESMFASGRASVRIALLTGSQAVVNFSSSTRREDIVRWIAEGNVHLVVGTHALIQEGVQFHKLGVAVVDEQHRFGALQRATLRGKGADVDPDLLIMTATPIPRTLAMTLYGDLDVSTIDEMPPGRLEVVTEALPWARQDEAWEIVRAEVDSGRQAFVVCPLVEESEKIESTSAIAEHLRLQGVFPGFRLGLMHGQLPSKEKEEVMRLFRSGDIDVLVATTVIEVGIDVPNATVMIIEGADRFGLSQLHQLRGRVGRGEHAGHCVLLCDPTTDEGGARIEAMVATSDGFRLAEEDLRIRGQGTVFGTRQSGMGDLRIADILKDFEILVDARKEAFDLVAEDPNLQAHPELAEEIQALMGESVEWLFVS